jgi:hypothetical protein
MTSENSRTANGYRLITGRWAESMVAVILAATAGGGAEAVAENRFLVATK